MRSVLHLVVLAGWLGACLTLGGAPKSPADAVLEAKAVATKAESGVSAACDAYAAAVAGHLIKHDKAAQDVCAADAALRQ